MVERAMVAKQKEADENDSTPPAKPVSVPEIKVSGCCSWGQELSWELSLTLFSLMSLTDRIQGSRS